MNNNVNNSNSELEQARQNVQRAKARAQSGGCGCFGDSFEKKAEGSIQLYQKAVVVFQREKQYHEAGNCLKEIAFLKERIGQSADEDYQEAAHCFSFVDKKESLEIMKTMVRKYENQGKHDKAAEAYENMAQHFEEQKDFKTAVMFYERAADSHSLCRNNKSKERSCRLKYADLSCINSLGQWKDFIEVYENVGKQYLLEPMLKYSAKDMFFKIVCLYLLHEDYIQARSTLSNFKGQDPSLSDSSESNFLDGIIESFKNNNKSEFEKAYSQYKQTNSGSYDTWNKTIIGKIYNKIQSSCIDKDGNELKEEDFLGGGNNENENKDINGVNNINPDNFL